MSNKQFLPFYRTELRVIYNQTGGDLDQFLDILAQIFADKDDVIEKLKEENDRS